MLDDAKHVIGVDARDGSKMILENIENGSIFEFQGNFTTGYFITIPFYDEETGFLYCGEIEGELQKLKFDNEKKTCKLVKNYGDLEIGRNTSYYRFLDNVFFGGNEGKIKVLDLSTAEFFPDYLYTSIGWIISLQICRKSLDKIYLTVTGSEYDYSDDKTDLFDVSGLLLKNPIIFKKFLSENSIDHEESILPL